MKKRAKMLCGILLGLSLTLGSVVATPVTTSAATQYNGSYYGIGLDYNDTGAMEAADGWSNGGMFNCTWRASNIWFSDGLMNLKIDRDSKTGGFSGAEYRTKQKFGYGMYDVKMKPIKNDGVVSSFFTYTGPTDGTVWDEIDIEFLGKDTTKVQFNYYTNGVGNHEYLYDLGFDASKSLHQYGFYWEPGKITWYVDKKPVYSATTNIPSTPGKIMMNVWNGKGVDEWLKPYNGRTPLVAQYDWASYTKGGASNSGSSGNQSTPTSNVSFNSKQTYKLINVNSQKALDLYYGSKEDGANILQYTYNGYQNQKWYLQSLNNGYFKIINAASGKALDGAGTSAGANVQQWSFGNGENQQWSIQKVNGNYKIINRKSGLALDVSGASKSDNANVLQWNYKGSNNQLWRVALAYLLFVLIFIFSLGVPTSF